MILEFKNYPLYDDFSKTSLNIIEILIQTFKASFSNPHHHL
ncbi:hypothetical protein pb186bvf_005017 [Paramecium bursaria]